MLTRSGHRTWAWVPMRRPRISVNRISLGMGACGLVLIVLVSSVVAWRERQIAFHDARREARDAAFALADHAARLFEVADLALRTTTLELGNRSWDDAGASRPLWDEMRITNEALPYIGDIWLNDASGLLRLATVAFPTPPSDARGRSSFAAIARGDPGLVIGEPFVGRVTHAPTFLIARRLVGPDGAFRGMVSATAELGYFLDYWRRIALPRGDHVALVRAEGTEVLVRLPEDPPIAPTSLSALRIAAAADPVAGRYAPSGDRTGFYHRVGDLPLYLTVSLSKADVEDAWRAWFWTFLILPGLAILALAAIMVLARRQNRIEARANRDVARARAQLERRVAERTADLQESNAEIQRFAYIVSHDLRAPLVNIMGFTSELERMRGEIFSDPAAAAASSPAALREDFDEAIGFIQTSIDKMDRLIKAILMLARQGTRVFAPEPVDMEALMRAIADGVAHQAQSAGTEIAIGPLPPLVIDRIAVEQLFSNLVDNAVKYLRPGIPGEIAISAEVAAGRAVFRVTDNGRGIEARDHARVFELFRRSGTQDRAGDGIGLAHVKTLVRQLGGTISLASTPGRGSTFTVVLPLAAEGATP